MLELLAQGVPTLPDLTHPQELLQFGQHILQLNKWLVVLLAGFGVVLAAINFSYRRGALRANWLDLGVDRYGQLLYAVQHTLLLIVILVAGFFLCSTLANRYHHWEQDKLAQVASTVAGDRVEQPAPQGDYRFPVKLAPGESTQFRVTYKAQGAPRWVFTANGRLLSKFRLTVLANFPNADFASGIVPSEMTAAGQGTRFTWAFDENVSVQNPFGVFTATQRVRNTGVLPRLLLLAPGIFLWWLLLLYLTVPLRMRDVAVSAGIFFACLLCLTYASRLFDAKLAWALLMPILLLFGWSLGLQRQTRWGAAIVTFSGVVLPVLGFLVPYTGLTLGISGLISVGWLMAAYVKRSDDA